MRTAKQWSYLLLALVMIVSLAACGGNGTTPDSSAAAPSGTAPSSSASSAGTDGQSGAASDTGSPNPATVVPVSDKRLKFSMAVNAPIEGYDYTAGDPYAKWWSDRYNWDIEMIGLTGDNWDEMLRIWINSRDMPDVCIFNYTTKSHADAASWVEQELIKKMPDDWRTRWPNAASVVDKTSLGPEMERAYDGVYFLPRARFDENLPGDPLPNHMCLSIRKDWLEAVDMEVKDAYKISEIIEFGKRVKEKDPGGIGANLLPITSRPGYTINMFVYHNSQNYNTFYKDTDGQYKWGAAHPDTLEGLKLYYDAYASGALNQEFFTLKGDDDRDQFYVSGVAGAVYQGSTSTGMQINQETRFKNTGLDPDDCVHLANILGEDGKYHQVDLINYWGTLIFSPDIDDEVFERFMDMLDYGCTEEGYRLQVAAFEGEDWEYDANGNMVCLLPEGMPLEGANGKYPSMGYLLGCLKLWDDFSFENPNVIEKYRTRSRDLYADRVKNGSPETFPKTDWTVWTYDSPARRKVSFDYATEFANIVVNAKSADDVEASWNAWIDSQMGLVQPVLDELNAL
ncbi:MAG: ABC transporter substrate-binding protein [Oscillospiraceae bacterium]|jgi:putative aldouronate transport system substrate-binding protein|nr:ABC transporter substrate-binding protein [Oscillospiraceae bacterium]